MDGAALMLGDLQLWDLMVLWPLGFHLSAGPQGQGQAALEEERQSESSFRFVEVLAQEVVLPVAHAEEEEEVEDPAFFWDFGLSGCVVDPQQWDEDAEAEAGASSASPAPGTGADPRGAGRSPSPSSSEEAGHHDTNAPLSPYYAAATPVEPSHTGTTAAPPTNGARGSPMPPVFFILKAASGADLVASGDEHAGFEDADEKYSGGDYQVDDYDHTVFDSVLLLHDAESRTEFESEFSSSEEHFEGDMLASAIAVAAAVKVVTSTGGRDSASSGDDDADEEEAAPAQAEDGEAQLSLAPPAFELPSTGSSSVVVVGEDELALEKVDTRDSQCGAFHGYSNATGEHTCVVKCYDHESRDRSTGRPQRVGEWSQLREGVVVGDAFKKEVAAYQLDPAHVFGVPETKVALVPRGAFPDGSPVAASSCSSSSSSSALSSSPSSGSSPSPLSSSSSSSSSRSSPRHQRKMCSVQQFVASKGDAGEFGEGTFDAYEVQKIAVLDMTIANLDRTAQNILVTRRNTLVPIDHGLSLPDFRRLGDLSFVWLDWKQSKQPLAPALATHVRSIDPRAGAASLRALAVPEASILTYLLCVALLQAGVGAGLSAFDIGALMCLGKVYSSATDSSALSALEQLRDVAAELGDRSSSSSFKFDPSVPAEVHAASFLAGFSHLARLHCREVAAANSAGVSPPAVPFSSPVLVSSPRRASRGVSPTATASLAPPSSVLSPPRDARSGGRSASPAGSRRSAHSSPRSRKRKADAAVASSPPAAGAGNDFASAVAAFDLMSPSQKRRVLWDDAAAAAEEPSLANPHQKRKLLAPVPGCGDDVDDDEDEEAAEDEEYMRYRP